jgi:heme exporter protein D
VWVAAVGTAMGLFGFLYVPYLKRRRNLAAQRRQAAQDRDRQADMDHSAAASSGDRD